MYLLMALDIPVYNLFFVLTSLYLALKSSKLSGLPSSCITCLTFRIPSDSQSFSLITFFALLMFALKYKGSSGESMSMAEDLARS